MSVTGREQGLAGPEGFAVRRLADRQAAEPVEAARQRADEQPRHVLHDEQRDGQLAGQVSQRS